jgi:hypothetical protein
MIQGNVWAAREHRHTCRVLKVPLGHSLESDVSCCDIVNKQIRNEGQVCSPTQKTNWNNEATTQAIRPQSCY